MGSLSRDTETCPCTMQESSIPKTFLGLHQTGYVFPRILYHNYYLQVPRVIPGMVPMNTVCTSPPPPPPPPSILGFSSPQGNSQDCPINTLHTSLRPCPSVPGFPSTQGNSQDGPMNTLHVLGSSPTSFPIVVQSC